MKNKHKTLTTIFLITLASMFCRLVEQIAVNRPGKSWLPYSFFDRSAAFNLDFYHVASNLEWLIPICGIIYLLIDTWKARIIIAVSVFFTHGFLFDLNYHVILIRLSEWDYENSLVGQIVSLIF